MSHLKVQDAIRILDQGGNDRDGCLYMEIGMYKPFMIPTIIALRRRGYRVDDLSSTTFLLHPKGEKS